MVPGIFYLIRAEAAQIVFPCLLLWNSEILTINVRSWGGRWGGWCLRCSGDPVVVTPCHTMNPCACCDGNCWNSPGILMLRVLDQWRCFVLREMWGKWVSWCIWPFLGEWSGQFSSLCLHTSFFPAFNQVLRYRAPNPHFTRPGAGPASF